MLPSKIFGLSAKAFGPNNGHWNQDRTARIEAAQIPQKGLLFILINDL